MRKKISLALLILSVCSVLVSAQPVNAAGNEVTLRASLSISGEQGNGRSFWPTTTSKTGRFVAFPSLSNNLVPNDTNNEADIFVKDLQTGSVVRANLDSLNNQTNSGANYPHISGNGRYVVFVTLLPLVITDNNNKSDIYLRDLINNTTELVTLTNTGGLGDGDSVSPVISYDGSYITFQSTSTNLVNNDTNNKSDIFIRDRAQGKTERVSVDSQEQQLTNGAEIRLNGDVKNLSDDGRYVIFDASRFDFGSMGSESVYIRDRMSGTTTLVSTSTNGTPNYWAADDSIISADGNTIVFSSQDKDLDPQNIETSQVIYEINYIKNLQTGKTTRLIPPYGIGSTIYTTISDDGRYVAYSSYDSSNNNTTVFKYDIAMGTTQQVAPNVTSPAGNHFPFISGDGKVVTYWSESNSLVTGDTNNEADIFVFGLITPPAPTNFRAVPGPNTKQMSLSWTAAVDGGSPITSYRIYRGTTTSNMLQVASVLGGVTSFTDRVGSSPSYYYTVSAVNNSGEGIQTAILQAINPWFLLP